MEDYQYTRNEAQRILRDIQSHTVIPRKIYGQIHDLLDRLAQERILQKDRGFVERLNNIPFQCIKDYMMNVCFHPLIFIKQEKMERCTMCYRMWTYWTQIMTLMNHR